MFYCMVLAVSLVYAFLHLRSPLNILGNILLPEHQCLVTSEILQGSKDVYAGLTDIQECKGIAAFSNNSWELGKIAYSIS